MTLTEEILKDLPGVLDRLRHTDRLLTALREDNAPIPQVVKQSQLPLGSLEWDVVVSGGTLGILIGCALVQMGWRVALIERGILRGREQEWNISRLELEVFLELNLLTVAELERSIATQYNPARISFSLGAEIWIEGVLNIGIDPVFLLETLKQRFVDAGGCLLENTLFEGVVVHPDGVMVEATKQNFKTRLLLDVMGYVSPIAQQVRQGQKPDGICLVVGSCAQGFASNDRGDLLISFTPLQNQCQYFWEAFPARDGRTTYLFTYTNADPKHLGLEALFEEYLRLLPEYQNVEIAQLQLRRALFGFFPSYRHPSKYPWSRILPVGDSSGNQSPLSFGGFGAMVRHLKRLTVGIDEALQTDQLSSSALALLQPYQPNLSVTWLFQRAMSAGIEQKVAPEQINQLLSVVFLEMSQLGESVLKPFLQDIVQFPALTRTLLKTASSHPGLVARVIPQVGLGNLLDWIVHYINLGGYSALFELAKGLEPWVKNLPPATQFYCRRWIEAWKYGSGRDYSS